MGESYHRAAVFGSLTPPPHHVLNWCNRGQARGANDSTGFPSIPDDKRDSIPGGGDSSGRT